MKTKKHSYYDQLKEFRFKIRRNELCTKKPAFHEYFSRFTKDTMIFSASFMR